MDFSQFVKACNFAATKHINQRRKQQSSPPYINHPLEVAYILSECGVDDVATLCAAVLHDTIEDTKTTEEELVKEFGEQVTKIVIQCSDDKSLPKVQRKIHQIEHAKHVSNKAKLVKLADKLSNNKSLIEQPIWTPERNLGYAVWSHKVFVNLRGINKQLDDKLCSCLEQLGVYKHTEEEQDRLLNQYYKDLQEK